MRNSTLLTDKRIIEMMEHHSVATKYDADGRLFVLDQSTFQGKLLSVWVKAPQTLKSVRCFLGY